MAKKKKKRTNNNEHPVTEYTIYTDGGCAFNPGGPGGCAAIVINNVSGERTEISEAYDCTTNNRMEIMAVLLGMRCIPTNSSILLYSDSTYVLNTITGQYRKKKNVDLWEELGLALKGKKVYTQWVPGHSGIPENERCDRLCLEAMNYMEKKVDQGYQEQKEEGRVFYEKVDKISGGAMAIEINLPDPFNTETFSFCSVNEYCDKYHVKKSCAKSVLDFYMYEKSSFKDYIAIKTGGIDSWSRKSTESIKEILEGQGMDEETFNDLTNAISTYIDSAKDRISCLRWYMRGLPLRDCIRKCLVMMEVAENCM